MGIRELNLVTGRPCAGVYAYRLAPVAAVTAAGERGTKYDRQET
jgi:hypothetical protein